MDALKIIYLGLRICTRIWHINAFVESCHKNSNDMVDFGWTSSSVPPLSVTERRAVGLRRAIGTVEGGETSGTPSSVDQLWRIARQGRRQVTGKQKTSQPLISIVRASKSTRNACPVGKMILSAHFATLNSLSSSHPPTLSFKRKQKCYTLASYVVYFTFFFHPAAPSEASG